MKHPLPSPDLDSARVLKTTEVATMLGCKPETIRRWANAPDAPLRPIGTPGQLRFLAADVRRLLEGRR